MLLSPILLDAEAVGRVGFVSIKAQCKHTPWPDTPSMQSSYC